MHSTRLLSWSKWLTAVLLTLVAVPTFAQVRILGGRPQSNLPGLRGGTLFPEKREWTQAIRQSQELIRDEKYEQGFKNLQKIIGSDKDFFFYENAERKDRFLSHKAMALRIIGSLPEKGRDAYELIYGLKARTILNDAMKAGNFQEITNVARRYFHTKAGYRATYLLATQKLDAGKPLTAALLFQRLRRITRSDVRDRFEPMLSLQTAVCWGRAGLPKLSIETLLDLKKRTNGKGIVIGGKRVALFGSRETALPWLVKILGGQRGFAKLGQEQWTMFRGDASRTARSAPASPVWDSQWILNTVIDTDAKPGHRRLIEKVAADIKSFAQRRKREGLLMQPAAHPLLVGNLAIFRTLSRVWAVNIHTGEIEWKAFVPDRAFEQEAGLVAKLNRNTVNRNTGKIILGGFRTSSVNLNPLEMLLDQRLWRDMTAGTLSSDGQMVFSVEDLGYHNRNTPIRRVGRVYQRPELPSSNKLFAFDTKTGKITWAAGGKVMADKKHPLPLQGYFFLGPPLPLGGQLFCLADYQGEIRLLVIGVSKKPDADGILRDTPKLLWYQTLIQPNEGVSTFPLRRMAGLTPSYAGGVLICPTTGGAVVAVDPSRRLLLWGYRYSVNTNGNSGRRRGFSTRRSGFPTNPYDAESRWLDAGVTIAGNHVILTPRDSNELHCINLDGDKQWVMTRGQLLYVAAVHQGNVILVGKSQVAAFRLSDGKPAWKRDTPLPRPSGRGFQTGRFYHIPLQTAEVATIDLSNGRILARTKTRSGAIPGNLVSANGFIVSQSIDRVMSFRPFDVINREIAAKLKADSSDAKALALRGEIRLRAGDEQSGLNDLRKSIRKQPSDRARSLLAANLLEGLRLDFATFRKYRPELEKLLATDSLRAQYHRLLAAGLHEVGEHRDAFREYVRLAGPDTGPWRNERVSGDLTVRSDRWLRTRVADVYSQADPTQRNLLVADLQRQLDAAIKRSGPAALRRFVTAFGDLPKTEDARLELSKRLGKTNPLELEFVLEKLRKSRDLKTAGFATAGLAQLFASHGHFQVAADLVAELDGRFATIVCVNGQHGKQVALALKSKNAQLESAYSFRSVWPRKRIIANTVRSAGSRSFPNTQNYPMDFVGGRGPYFRNWSFRLISNRRKLEARDGLGKVRWELDTKLKGSSYSNYGNSLKVHGHLVVLTMGNRFVVIDGLSKTPKILWHRSLFEAPFGQPANRGVRVRRIIRAANGRIRWVITDPYGNPLGMVGPISNDAIVYQAGRTVFAADPLTGEILWKRGSAERGSRLFGDDEHVFLVAPGTTTATVVRISDGSLIGSRPVAASSIRKASNGRFELTGRLSGVKFVLSYVDILKKQILWQKHYSANAKIVVIEGEEIGVVEPRIGRFTILGLADGKVHLNSGIERDNGLSRFMVRRSSEQYLLMTYSSLNRNARFRAAAISTFSPMVNGYVYGFDRKTGKRTWTTFVGNQSVDLVQPESLPVLVFAARRYEIVRRRRGGRLMPSVYRLGVTILDTRNGRVLLDYDGIVRYPYTYQLSVDPAARKIEVKFRQMQITLTMANKPLRKPDPQFRLRPNGPAKTKTVIDAKKAVPGNGIVPPVPRAVKPR